MRRENDPIGSFRFLLELGSIQVAAFSECTGLQLETKVFEYKEGGCNSHSLKFPETGSVGNITLKRGITSGAHSDALYKWHMDVMTGSFDPNKNLNRRISRSTDKKDQPCNIILNDDDGYEVKRWNLYRPFPVKWTGPEFKATSGELAIETLELACEGIFLIEQ